MALVFIALSVVVLIVNKGSMEVDLLITTIHAARSFVLLGFIALGVIIGVLMK